MRLLTLTVIFPVSVNLSEFDTKFINTRLRRLTSELYTIWAILASQIILKPSFFLSTLEPKNILDFAEHSLKLELLDGQLECFCCELGHIKNIFDQIEQQSWRNLSDLKSTYWVSVVSSRMSGWLFWNSQTTFWVLQMWCWLVGVNL